jgi:hypothetical protein
MYSEYNIIDFITFYLSIIIIYSTLIALIKHGSMVHDWSNIWVFLLNFPVSTDCFSCMLLITELWQGHCISQIYLAFFLNIVFISSDVHFKATMESCLCSHWGETLKKCKQIKYAVKKWWNLCASICSLYRY